MTAGTRFLLTLGIVLSMLLALSFCGYNRWAPMDADAQPLPAPRPTQPVTLSKYERQFIDLDREAIRDAYKEQVHHLFLTWAKDDRDQPARAVTGAKKARAMYENSMTAIDEREQRYLREGGK